MDGVIVILFALNYFSFSRQSHSYLNCLCHIVLLLHILYHKQI